MTSRQRPLNQDEYTMRIVKDLGTTTARPDTTSLARYALFECTICKNPFKARCGSTSAKKQTSCRECTLSPGQQYKHPLYAIWNGIKQRCYSPKRKDYCRYGGIGVTMCPEWLNDSSSFISWCLANGWEASLVVDKDIKCRTQNISPTIYAPHTLSFITVQANAEEANAKTVLQYTLDGEFLAEHVSTVKAVLSLGKKRSSKTGVANCCRGVSHTAFGFKWKYK